jgi:phospholipase A1/A2
VSSLSPTGEERGERWWQWLGVEGGFRHESNGLGGVDSRALNEVFARPMFAFGNLDGWRLLIAPELSAYVMRLGENPELPRYREYGRLRGSFGRDDGPALGFSGWTGRGFRNQSVQLDLTIPWRIRLLDFESYLLIQYFNGYVETLLDFDQRTDAVRAGISLVR